MMAIAINCFSTLAYAVWLKTNGTLQRLLQVENKWYIAEIIAKGKCIINENSEQDEDIVFPPATIEYAKNWLNMRYFEFFLREIFPTYAINAKNSLESWDNTPKSTKFVG
jgi:hypothetical protein